MISIINTLNILRQSFTEYFSMKWNFHFSSCSIVLSKIISYFEKQVCIQVVREKLFRNTDVC